MKGEKFFEDWKGDWKERTEDFHTDQAELFRHIRDRNNLEIRLERRIEKIMNEIESSRTHKGKRTRLGRKPNNRNS